MWRREETDWNRDEEYRRSLAYSTYNLTPGVIEHDRIQRQFLLSRSTVGYDLKQDMQFPSEEYQFKRHYEAYPYYYEKFYENYPYSLPPEKAYAYQYNHDFIMNNEKTGEITSNRPFLDNKPPRTYTSTFQLIYKDGIVAEGKGEKNNQSIGDFPPQNSKELSASGSKTQGNPPLLPSEGIPQGITPKNYYSFDRYETKNTSDNIISFQKPITQIDYPETGSLQNNQFYAEESDKRLQNLQEWREFNQSKTHMVHLFSEMMAFEREVEDLRVQINLEKDFNVQKLFEMFDEERKEQITPFELDKGFKHLGVFAEKTELYLLIARYSENEEPTDVLTKEEFIKAIEPSKCVNKDKENRKAQENEQNNNIVQIKKQHKKEQQEEFNLIGRTKQLVVRLLKMMVRQETTIQHYAQEIISKKYNLADLFSQFKSKQGFGVVLKEELADWLCENKIYANPSHLKRFLERFDRTQANSIGFQQFVEEFSLKQPVFPKRKKYRE